MAPSLPAPRPLDLALARLRRGATLARVLGPGEARAVLGGQRWTLGLCALAEDLRGLDAEATLATLVPHRAGELAGRSLWMLELPLDAEGLARAARVPVDRLPADPLEAWIPRLRRDDGSPLGVYQGDGRCPGLARPVELLLAAPTPLPAGARLLRRGREDLHVATLGPEGWALSPGAPAGLARHLAPPGPAPAPLNPEDDTRALRFGPVVSASLRRQVAACTAPGLRWASVEERFLRFNWLRVAGTGRELTLQHQGGALLELWLDDEGLILHARCVEGEEAVVLDHSVGRWHREGRPLIEAPEAAELIFVEGSPAEPSGQLTVAIEPDGWASVTARGAEAARSWSGQVDPAVRRRLRELLRAAGLPRGAPGPAGSGPLLELRADGQRLQTRVGAGPEGEAFAPLVEELRRLRDTLTHGALRP